MTDLNSLTQQVPTSDGFVKHPVGTFNGIIIDVKEVWVEKLGKKVYEIFTKTSEGKPPSMPLFGVSDHDVQQAQYNADAKDRVFQTIGRMKHFVGSISGAPKAETDRWNWSDLMSGLANLVNMPVEVVVKVNERDSKYLTVYINPKTQGQPVSSQAPQTQPQSHVPSQAPQSQGFYQPPAGQPQQPPAGHVPQQAGVPGSTDLANVPF